MKKMKPEGTYLEQKLLRERTDIIKKALHGQSVDSLREMISWIWDQFVSYGISILWFTLVVLESER